MRRILSLSLLVLTLNGCLPQQARHDTASPALNAPPSTDRTATTTIAAIQWSQPDQSGEICVPPLDIWDRIREGMTLPDHDHPGVRADLEWYASHQGYLDRVVTRASPYLHLVVEAVEERNLPTELVLLPVVESAYQPFAYSHGRAAGLWQFIPGTGRRFDLKQSWWYDGRRDVAASTRAALDYLEYLRDHFDGEWLLAIAAYNSGEGTVKRAVARNKARGKPTDFWSLDLPRETRGYVPKLLAISRLIKDPEAHGVSLGPVPNEPFLTSVELDSQIDLALAAELADISLEDIYLYNPGFNRWATDPDGPYDLLLPIERVDTFKQKLAAYPPERRVRWERHRVKSGESLLQIAQNYRTTVELLKSVNNLRSNTIRAGDYLTIPVARQKLASYRLSEEQRLIATQNQPREGRRIDYQVKHGDSLWGIARRYDVGVNELARWNGMAPRDPLLPGRTLVIWTDAKADTVAAINPARFTHPFSSSTRQRIGYVVRSGDSLATISQRFRVSVDNLISWNKLDGKKYLQPGQRLTLYVDVIRQSENL
ncbi:lytic transglycosylase [Sulfurivermis fontis]|uniref:lytic transglycosylase n=1 Tax=Sulfurivermis fontis TaxID=1972068 RepID=UPI000FD8A96A|nr:LysM peptidoglycan-binding domain-containing protein [Sulfurivermis fontis]